MNDWCYEMRHIMWISWIRVSHIEYSDKIVTINKCVCWWRISLATTLPPLSSSCLFIIPLSSLDNIADNSLKRLQKDLNVCLNFVGKFIIVHSKIMKHLPAKNLTIIQILMRCACSVTYPLSTKLKPDEVFNPHHVVQLCWPAERVLYPEV